MSLIVVRSGLEMNVDPFVVCHPCGQPGLPADDMWACFPPIEDEGRRAVIMVHSSCAASGVGLPHVTQWRGTDFFARLLEPRGETVLEAIERARQKPWSHRPTRRR
jgi:hypothetical protein